MEQEVGGSSPPNCTSEIKPASSLLNGSELKQLLQPSHFDQRLNMRCVSTGFSGCGWVLYCLRIRPRLVGRVGVVYGWWSFGESRDRKSSG